ncbi:uncharacterized protein EMH_0049380 [Eimeria mitis]|uniref:Uncharacterized protein n=1 Tax=Eimeria mitis TaxID=44415 RepID=U6JXF0_9EIME|nr:uncharacterized protein EMH_0049380 [Eimeria mitis]CDJ29411.1 hypothetical protein, conserved [Eimeria mitis]
MRKVQLFLPLSAVLLTTVLAANGSNETADVSVQTVYPDNQNDEATLDSKGGNTPADTRRRDAAALLLLTAVVAGVFFAVQTFTASKPTKPSVTEVPLERPHVPEEEVPLVNQLSLSMLPCRDNILRRMLMSFLDECKISGGCR